MIRNALISAWRQILKQKFYSLINVLGLAVGIASALLLFRVVQFHQSFEYLQPSPDRVYRVITSSRQEGVVNKSSGVPFPFAPALKLAMPGLEIISPIFQGYQTQVTILKGSSQAENSKFKEELGVLYVQGSFFRLFNFPWLAGDAASMDKPGTAALSLSYASKYFGDWHTAIGKSIRVDNNQTFLITGVYSDPPANTDMQVHVALSYLSLKSATDTNWGNLWSSNMCFIRVAPGESTGLLQAQLTHFARTNRGNADSTRNYVLQPLLSAHTDTSVGSVMVDPVGKSILLSLTMLGVFLILIACINFINLATARAVNRAKEVGVRKVLGSSRGQIMFFYLGEAFILTFISVLISLVLCLGLFPQVRNLMGLPVSVHFLNDFILLVMAVLLITSTLLSGLYPAFILSRYNPVEAIRSRHAAQGSAQVYLRRALVGMQFLISQVLVICTLIGLNQVNYFMHSPLGFNKDAIVMVPVPADSISHTRLRLLRQEILAIPGVENLAFSGTDPLSNSDAEMGFTLEGAGHRADFPANVKFADSSFFATYQLRFIAGHSFRQADTASQFVINETMLHKLGFKNAEAALGRRISIDGTVPKPITGVIADYHNGTFSRGIDPILLTSTLAQYQRMGVKFSAADTRAGIEQLGKIWKRTFPAFVYEFTFLDKAIAANYEEQQRLASLFRIFACISIFIGCLGLYGLVSFMAVQKTKEIGIRKVLGASILQILQLFSQEFMLLVFFSFLLSIPAAWYLMDQWLSNFKFHITISWVYFAIAGMLTWALALVTIAGKGLQAARTNPAKNLRVE